jgi:hypothetical protein
VLRCCTDDRRIGSTYGAAVRARLTPNRILVVVALVAAGLVAALIAVSVWGGKGEAAPMSSMYGAAATRNLLGGIPQHGNVLGNPDAPVTVVEFADLQCPYCRMWALDTFPTVVREYVRPGKVKLVFAASPSWARTRCRRLTSGR